ncbi:MAG: DUF692 family protein [Deltaproteobacteria bacterium]|jgi:uncharacterized protein (UPF0276 family)|nr:DUF692 family protein [Deltaproteobacteria bacterium]
MIRLDPNNKNALRLALPVSHLLTRPTAAALRLVDATEVLEIKYLPVPDWLSSEAPTVFHWGLGTTEKDFGRLFPPVGSFLAENKVELFSFDLGPSASRRLGLIPLSAVLSPKEIIETSDRNLDLVRRFYAGPLAAENYNYYPTGLYEHICRPDFIGEFLERLKLGLVLDLAHAAVSAWNLGLEIKKYLAELPLSEVKEIHISRPHLPRDRRALAADAHQCPGAREFEWLKTVLNLLPPELPPPLVAVEYYGNAAKLLTAIKEVREFDNNHL